MSVADNPALSELISPYNSSKAKLTDKCWIQAALFMIDNALVIKPTPETEVTPNCIAKFRVFTSDCINMKCARRKMSRMMSNILSELDRADCYPLIVHPDSIKVMIKVGEGCVPQAVRHLVGLSYLTKIKIIEADHEDESEPDNLPETSCIPSRLEDLCKPQLAKWLIEQALTIKTYDDTVLPQFITTSMQKMVTNQIPAKFANDLMHCLIPLLAEIHRFDFLDLISHPACTGLKMEVPGINVLAKVVRHLGSLRQLKFLILEEIRPRSYYVDCLFGHL